MASTLQNPHDEFVPEEVNSEAYQNRQMGLVFDQGFSFSGFERDRVWLRTPSGFVDVSAVSGADDENDGRALVVADFDDDGDPDFFVHDIQRERHHLYRNDVADGSGNASVKIRLRGTKAPAEAMGATVRVKTGGRVLAQSLAFGSGFLSQNAPELVFGVGTAPDAEVSVAWPGGERESFGTVEAGGTYLLVQGKGRPQRLARRPFRFADPPSRGLRVRVGQNLPALGVIDARSGDVGSLDVQERDGTLLVNVWATWCKACLGELPLLQKLDEQGRYRVVLLGVDPPSSRDRARDLLARKGVGAEAWFLDEQEAARWFDLERLPLPTTLIVRDGRVERVIQGALPEGGP